ncbi:hypothetical protein T11_18342 [Trichinella zimbabwensis]|uniref:Uncharacterized protein n=1 Tax=Trichinella zimbabwensis TaxID=268475 RepID=A0A0V1H7V7_9BILA|nr:hypothetical protein T11_18342 [Trichinella zimbabwensis]
MLSWNFNSSVHYSATIFVEDQRFLLCGYSTYRQEIQGQFRSMSNVVGHHRLLSSEGNFHDPASFSRYICSIGNGHCVCSATIVLFHPIVAMSQMRCGA